MTFKLHEITDDSEFGPIAPVQDKAYRAPFNGFWEILKGESLEDWQTRQKLWHHHDPSSHWLYVTDEKTGKVAGAIQWNIYKKNPYENGPPVLIADWFKDKNMQEVSNQVFAQFFSARPAIMSKPHFLISYCFVDPEFRKQGAASLMMDWGLKQADARGMQAFVESTEHGQGFYAAHGFEDIRDFNLDAAVPEPTEEFSKVRKETFGLPLHGYIMQRPIGGQKA